MKKKEYYKYLRSGKWRRKRQQKLEEAGAKCEECGSLKNLHIHHLTYARIGNELLSDLKVLCSSCHKEAHSTNATPSPRKQGKPGNWKGILNAIIMSIKTKVNPKTCNGYLTTIDKVVEERLKHKSLTYINKNGKVILTREKKRLNGNQINSLHYIKSNQQHVEKVVNSILKKSK